MVIVSLQTEHTAWLWGAVSVTSGRPRSQPYYLDVTHPEANKGTVVATLSKRLGIPPNLLAIADEIV